MAKHQRSGDWLELDDDEPREPGRAPDWLVAVLFILLFLALCVPAVVLRFR